MNTTEFCTQVHTTRDTLRFYDAMGLLVPQRTVNHYRQYSLADQQTFHIIHNLQHAGLSLTEIKAVLVLRQQPVTTRCRADTLAFIQRKQRTFTNQIDFYQHLVATTTAMTQAIDAGNNGQLDQLIDALGNSPVVHD